MAKVEEDKLGPYNVILYVILILGCYAKLRTQNYDNNFETGQEVPKVC